MAYLDDGEAADPRLIAPRLRQIAEIVVEAARRNGFRVNFRCGKTEGLVALYGEGAAEAWPLLEELAPVPELEQDGSLAAAVPVIPLRNGERLRVVQQYKHLGVLLAATGAMDRELARRVASGGAAC